MNAGGLLIFISIGLMKVPVISARGIGRDERLLDQGSKGTPTNKYFSFLIKLSSFHTVCTYLLSALYLVISGLFEQVWLVVVNLLIIVDNCLIKCVFIKF